MSDFAVKIKFLKWFKLSGERMGVRRVQPPSEPEKIAVEKWCHFWRLYFCHQLFQNLDKNSIFQLNFHQIFSKLFQNFPNQLCYLCKLAKVSRWVLKFLWKIVKNNAISALFLRNFSQFSTILLRPGDSALGPPRRPVITLKPLNCSFVCHCSNFE